MAAVKVDEVGAHLDYASIEQGGSILEPLQLHLWRRFSEELTETETVTSQRTACFVHAGRFLIRQGYFALALYVK